MLYRKAWSKLAQWKVQVPKKALCVTGARQVGKTTLIRHFTKENYGHFAELNFLTQPDATAIFNSALDADTLITNLTAFLQIPLVPHDTLILLDEIQECPQARTAIKFLVEDGRFDFVESGSLLGVRTKEVASYPVGFEEVFEMFPMDFEEYCLAAGVQPETIAYLRDCFTACTPVSEAVHETMNKLFYTYIVVGGMPEAVNLYIATHDIARVVRFQREILALYRMDITKYAQRDRAKIRDIFDAIPAQLDDKNRRFMLADLSKTARQLRYESSFFWLADAGVALPCYNVTEPKAPLLLNEKHSLFKLFFADTGLLCAATMQNLQFALLQGDVSVNLGSILENMMAQQLRCNGFGLHYFHGTKYGEIDFVVQQGSRVVPIEVKSGKAYAQHRALDNVLAVSEWGLTDAYVLCRGNLQKQGAVTYLPWYCVMFLQQETPPDTLHYEVDLSGLIV